MNPEDYKNPEWDKASRLFDWRNHVSTHDRTIWDSLTDEQKRSIAEHAEECAKWEEWD